MGELNFIFWATHRGPKEYSAVKLPPNIATRAYFHIACCERWNEILDLNLDAPHSTQDGPEGPVTKQKFCKICRNYVLTLWLMRSGSHVCGTPTTMVNNISNCSYVVKKGVLTESCLGHWKNTAWGLLQSKSIRKTKKGHIPWWYCFSTLLIIWCCRTFTGNRGSCTSLHD